MNKFMKAAMLASFLFSMTQPILAGTWRDDFSNPDTTKWEIFNISDWQQIPKVDTTKWEIEDGEVYGAQREFRRQSTFLTGKLTWKNYAVSCRAKFVGEWFPTVDLGLVLHVRPEEHKRYMFSMHYDEQRASIVEFSGKILLDDRILIKMKPHIFHFDVKSNSWYSLSAAVLNDDQLQFKIENLDDPDNKATFNAKTKEPIKEGGLAGFYVSHAEAVFDDLEIRGDNIPRGGTETFPVEPRGKLSTTWAKLKSK
ncbi:hypothetical protein C6501_09975 [Candidatus Poribacteria bacterium]|nr:MAG: hypothetical protein C6501_09975 [Candidatus Poribacteria bacterium]